MQQAVQEEVSKRLAKATTEIGEKYAAGKGGQDVSETGPTGYQYQARAEAEAAQRKAAKQEQKQYDAANDNAREEKRTQKAIEDGDEIDEGDDDDHELRNIRETRLKQIKRSQQNKLENLGKGHGQYREIVQDEFIKEVTSSDRTIVHFYHRDFPKCEIMHMHLQKLAKRHIEAKFVKIDAEKTMFFVNKLMIRSMPTVCLFFDGVCKDKIIGFDGLIDEDTPENKIDEWPTIRLARLLAAGGSINSEAVVDDDDVEAQARSKMESMRSSYINFAADDDEDDFDLDN